MSNKSTQAASNRKKPTFPLFAHPNGSWAKKINGRMFYFGSLKADPMGVEALKRFTLEYDDIVSGRRAKHGREPINIFELSNLFLAAKQTMLRAGDYNEREISPRTFADLKKTCQNLCDMLGKETVVETLGPSDFAALRAKLRAKQWSLATQANEVNRMRSVFRYAFSSGLIRNELRFPDDFKRPPKKALRIARAKRGVWMFSAAEVRSILAIAPVQLKAMVLLGIGCGLGNSDLANLRIGEIDLVGGWLNCPRLKTGCPRRAKLWPETISAIKAAIADRPEPADPDDKDLVFVTRTRQKWVRQTEKGGCFVDAISAEFRKLCRAAGIERSGATFYTMRRSYRTVADASLDQIAVGFTMGHTDGSVAGLYRQRIDDGRLERVAATVRDWLFPAGIESTTGTATEATATATETADKPEPEPVAMAG